MLAVMVWRYLPRLKYGGRKMASRRSAMRAPAMATRSHGKGRGLRDSSEDTSSSSEGMAISLGGGGGASESGRRSESSHGGSSRRGPQRRSYIPPTPASRRTSKRTAGVRRYSREERSPSSGCRG